MPSNQSPFQFPVGISDYRQLVAGNYLYVDKSLGIRDILNGSAVSIICRPRRFGKTLFMSMLQHFFAENVIGESTQGLFNPSLLNQKYPQIIEEHQGKYSVIYLTCKDIKYSSFESAHQGFQGLLVRLFREHQSLLESPLLSETERAAFNRILSKTADEDETRSALKDLSYYLHKAHGKPVIVLIDEYDTPILSAYTNKYYEEMIPFIRAFLGAGLKDNPYVFKSVVTGIIRIAKENLFSDLNNPEVYSPLKNTYGDYFGFTEDEINTLLQKTNLTSQASAIKHWYNGYWIGGHTIYNPWSIISCLKHAGVLEPYWVNTSGNELIRKILGEANANVKTELEKLIQGGSISCWIDEHVTFENLSKNETALWSLFLFSGYLTATKIKLDDTGYYQCELRIPNQELLHLYRRQVIGWFGDFLGYREYQEFIDNLLT